jgi:hypothetical protein
MLWWPLIATHFYKMSLNSAIRFNSWKLEHTDAHRQYCYHISQFSSLVMERKLNFPTYFVGNVQKYVLKMYFFTSVPFAEIVRSSCPLIKVIPRDQLNYTTLTWTRRRGVHNCKFVFPLYCYSCCNINPTLSILKMDSASGRCGWGTRLAPRKRPESMIFENKWRRDIVTSAFWKSAIEDKIFLFRK